VMEAALMLITAAVRPVYPAARDAAAARVRAFAAGTALHTRHAVLAARLATIDARSDGVAGDAEDAAALPAAPHAAKPLADGDAEALLANGTAHAGLAVETRAARPFASIWKPRRRHATACTVIAAEDFVRPDDRVTHVARRQIGREAVASPRLMRAPRRSLQPGKVVVCYFPAA